MTFEIIVVFITMGGALVLFVTEWVSFDVTAILIVGALILTGVIQPVDGLSGFSNQATIAIAAMLVLSEGLRKTGLLDVLSTTIARLAATRPTRAVWLMLLLVGIMSGFMNNTAVVALSIPIVSDLADRLRRTPYQLLMPLSFCSIFGGVCTLIGTSTNLLVSSIAVDHGQAPFAMFEFLPLGLPLLFIGFGYLMLVSPRLLGRRADDGQLTSRFEMTPYIRDVAVGRDFASEGGLEDAARVTEGLDVDVLEVVRPGAYDDSDQLVSIEEDWEEGDVVRVRGTKQDIGRMLDREKLLPVIGDRLDDAHLSAHELRLVEVVVHSDTGLVGQQIDLVGFRERFGATILALRRGNRLIHEGSATSLLNAGDTLLMLMPHDRIVEVERSPALILASRRPWIRYRRDRQWVALSIFAGVVAIGASQLLSVAVAALIGCAAMIVTGCLSSEEAYDAIPWKVIVLLAGVIPLGVAMEQTGAASWLKLNVLERTQALGSHGIIAGLVLLTMVLTNLMSNVATAAFLAPIAIQLAADQGLDPRPMLMAVTYGASLSFLSPVGDQTNLMIYGPGQYSYRDFLRLGGPLSVIVTIVATFLIPLIWPL